MLNLSNVVSRIKFKLGIANMALPFDNLDKMIVDIIQEFTVPIFSIYVPDKKISTVNAKESFKVLNQTTSHTTYLLPDFKEPKLLYIFDMYNNEDALTNLGYYAGTIPFSMTEGSLMGEMMLSNMTARMINAAVPKMTFDFEPPRTLKVYNAFWTNTFTIEWGFEHSKSLNTIPDDALPSFLQLALLDVKENLYPTVAQYQEQSTVYGTIRLPIDTWTNAESDRTELLRQWDDTYHLDGVPFYYG
jgi:hypothetical protein